ncbi:MAG: 4Fe-4S binding protein [Muribaculaceae bacterium]|nr:4Fe-4S binding protein [Muribaculaceae bacterium]
MLYNITFSPTGTSAKVADAITEGILSTAKLEPTRHNLTNSNAEEIELCADDIAVISAPVYGGKMAPIAKERMKNLKGDGTPCVIVAVYGNRAFENALNDMAEFVTERGFMPIAAAAFVGEHSYSSATNPIAVGRPDAKDISDAMKFGREIAEHLPANSLHRIDTTVLTDEPSPAESLTNFRNFVMSYIQQQKEAPRQYLPEVNTELCNECGACVDICPTGAIGDDCITVDASKCIKCCACVKSCPAGARSLFSPFAPVLSANFSQRKSPLTALGI